jgi:hypothetical protein
MRPLDPDPFYNIIRHNSYLKAPKQVSVFSLSSSYENDLAV